ncbi:MAG: AAA family ATPase [Chloroflexi bacterium]|nr:AAA family ATPase [Chloroflexota bacterium]MDA1269790.1 AAA family ATPase [Chloroflexota bacterium]
MYLKDFLSQSKETEWLVDRLIPGNSKILIAAPPGHGKSWTLEALAISVNSGQPFLNKYALDQAESVALLDQDTPSDILADRMRALSFDRPAPYIRVFSQEGLYIDTVRDTNRLIQYLEEIQPKLVILETLETITSDKFDENRAKDIDRLFKNLSLIQKEFQCAVVLSHHLGKGRQGTESGNRIRGSSALLARVDVAYTLQRLSGSNATRQFLIQPIPKRVQTVPGFLCELLTEENEGKLVAAEMRWVVDWTTNLDPALADGRTMVLDLLRDRAREGLTVNEAVQVSGGYFGDRETREILRSLLEEGLITRAVEAHGRFRFWLPEFVPSQSPAIALPAGVPSDGQWQDIESKLSSTQTQES